VAILFHCPWLNASVWLENLQRNAAGTAEIRVWPEVGDPAGIELACVFGLPDGALASLPNLKGICSLGAGIDHLLADPKLPRHVPIARLVDPIMAERMAEYVTAHALNHHLSTAEYEAQQRAGTWRRLPYRDARERTAAVLGLGNLGARCATMLGAVGFRVAGWSRTAKDLPGVVCRHGASGLEATLAEADILVLVLPATAATRNLIDAGTLARLPRGAALINVARGDLIDDAALVAALDAGQLSGATLDVFRVEPPPADAPWWGHPKVRLTPHVSSLSEPTSGMDIIWRQYLRLRAGAPMQDLVDLSRGY